MGFNLYEKDYNAGMWQEYDEKRKLMGYPVAEGHIAHEIAGVADGCRKRCPFGRNVIHYKVREETLGLCSKPHQKTEFFGLSTLLRGGFNWLTIHLSQRDKWKWEVQEP